MYKINDFVIIKKEEPGVFLKKGEIGKVIEIDENARIGSFNDWDIRVQTKNGKRWLCSKYVGKVDFNV